MSSRRTTQTIQRADGTIVKMDAANFLIQSAGFGMLLPLNLPEEFGQEGRNVLFSGELKEIGLNEFFAGQPIVLSAIAEKER